MAVSAANRIVRWFLGACALMLACSSGALAGSTVDTLHEFHLKDGAEPLAGLVWDKGELYGTTSRGGTTGCFSGGCGVVFKLTPTSGQTAWTETMLLQGGGPVILGSAGALLGVSPDGGSPNCYWVGNAYDGGSCGYIFKLAP